MIADTMDISDAEYARRMGNEYHRTRLAMARRLLGDVRGKRVFDFGCGEGSFLRMLAEDGAEVSGCDVSPELVSRCGGRAAVGGIEALERQEPVDVLSCLNVLSFVPRNEHGRFWTAARRLVNPGGRLLIIAVNARAGADRRNFVANPFTFGRFLAEHGFREIGQDFYRYYPLVSRFRRGDARVVDLTRLDRIPLWLRRRRATGYVSLSVKR